MTAFQRRSSSNPYSDPSDETRGFVFYDEWLRVYPVEFEENNTLVLCKS